MKLYLTTFLSVLALFPIMAQAQGFSVGTDITIVKDPTGIKDSVELLTNDANRALKIRKDPDTENIILSGSRIYKTYQTAKTPIQMISYESHQNSEDDQSNLKITIRLNATKQQAREIDRKMRPEMSGSCSTISESTYHQITHPLLPAEEQESIITFHIPPNCIKAYIPAMTLYMVKHLNLSPLTAGDMRHYVTPKIQANSTSVVKKLIKNHTSNICRDLDLSKTVAKLQSAIPQAMEITTPESEEDLEALRRKKMRTGREAADGPISYSSSRPFTSFGSDELILPPSFAAGAH